MLLLHSSDGTLAKTIRRGIGSTTDMVFSSTHEQRSHALGFHQWTRRPDSFLLRSSPPRPILPPLLSRPRFFNRRNHPIPPSRPPCLLFLLWPPFRRLHPIPCRLPLPLSWSSCLPTRPPPSHARLCSLLFCLFFLQLPSGQSGSSLRRNSALA